METDVCRKVVEPFFEAELEKWKSQVIYIQNQCQNTIIIYRAITKIIKKLYKYDNLLDKITRTCHAMTKMEY